MIVADPGASAMIVPDQYLHAKNLSSHGGRRLSACDDAIDACDDYLSVWYLPTCLTCLTELASAGLGIGDYNPLWNVDDAADDAAPAAADPSSKEQPDKEGEGAAEGPSDGAPKLPAKYAGWKRKQSKKSTDKQGEMKYYLVSPGGKTKVMECIPLIGSL